jgi:hypothetical protein
VRPKRASQLCTHVRARSHPRIFNLYRFAYEANSPLNQTVHQNLRFSPDFCPFATKISSINTHASPLSLHPRIHINRAVRLSSYLAEVHRSATDTRRFRRPQAKRPAQPRLCYTDAGAPPSTCCCRSRELAHPRVRRDALHRATSPMPTAMASSARRRRPQQPHTHTAIVGNVIVLMSTVWSRLCQIHHKPLLR